jgi:ribulose 1,5-bisphosphate carboxylase large subunit-like protein
MGYAESAVDSGANALMFSPYYGGGFLKMAEIAERFDVPVYSHPDGPAAGVKALILSCIS